MRALVLNATLKPSPEDSNTGMLAGFVGGVLSSEHGVEVEHVRLVDHDIAPGVVSEAVRPGDEWPALHDKILAADILIVATPTWLGQPSSVAKRALERMDGMISETGDDGTPVAFNRVAGVIVTGNEDGAHHCIAEISGALVDIGYTIPGQAWTYWNKGPGPGDEEYGSTDERDWTHDTGRSMAHVLVHTARALQASPIPELANA
jgi:multimeric flavodoxin WrbA